MKWFSVLKCAINVFSEDKLSNTNLTLSRPGGLWLSSGAKKWFIGKAFNIRMLLSTRIDRICIKKLLMIFNSVDCFAIVSLLNLKVHI